MLFRLVILSGPRKGHQITVDNAPTVIGRDEGCGICFKDDADMALRHAEVSHDRDGLKIRDLGTIPGLLINGREVRETRLKHGDRIEVGRTVLLVQARVPAEVEVSGVHHERRARRRQVAGMMLLFVAATAGFVLYVSHRMAQIEEEDQPAGPPPVPAITNPPPETVTEPEVPAPPAPPKEDEAGLDAEELKALRTDMAGLRDELKQLAAKPPAPPAEPARPHPAEARLTEARWAASERNFEKAMGLLVEIEKAHPDYVPALEEQALLNERNGRLQEAAEAWTKVIALGPGAPDFIRAAAERTRLLGMMTEPAAPESAPASPAGDEPAAAEPRVDASAVRLAGVTPTRFPPSESYDEMRSLLIRLEAAAAAPPPGNLKVVVDFLDRLESGEVVPTRAQVTPMPVPAGTEWSPEGAKDVYVTYTVPRGFFAGEAAAGRAFRYHGYRLRLLAGDTLLRETVYPPAPAAAPEPH